MRIITLTVIGAMEMTSICVEHYYQGSRLTLTDGLPATSKADKDYHGYGIKSMRYLVGRYQGELSISTDENIFSLKILLPTPQ